MQARYAAQLRKIARHAGELISSFDIGDLAALPHMQTMLEQYARSIEPWARAVSARLIAEVSRRDATAWFKSSQEIGSSLAWEIQNAPLGSEMRRILEDQVHLITSIPVDAGRRVQQFTLEYAAGGRRYDDLRDLIKDTSHVTASRATLIARTETAKAASAIMQARARYVGSEGYIWRTVHDRDVRKVHKLLDGTFHRWDDPPVAETNGQRHHPGEFPNCRCYAEPVLPAVIQ